MSEELTLRDKFAIEILNALICKKSNCAFDDIVNENPIIEDIDRARLKKLVMIAYVGADLMRELRLKEYK